MRVFAVTLPRNPGDTYSTTYTISADSFRILKSGGVKFLVDGGKVGYFPQVVSVVCQAP